MAGCFFLIVSLASLNAAQPRPNFYREVLPILQAHCQSCHRPGEIAPFSLMTYREARPWAQAIGVAVESRKMPPWFADLLRTLLERPFADPGADFDHCPLGRERRSRWQPERRATRSTFH